MSYHVNPIAQTLPRLGARSVGALGATPPPLSAPDLNQRVRIINTGFGVDAGALFRACMTDSIGPKELSPCFVAATKALPTLKGEQLAFHKSCMAQRSADVPVLLQHNACFAEAKKIAAGSEASAESASFPDMSMSTPATEAASPGGLPGGKWVWIAGAAAAAGLAFVLLKPAKS